MLKTKYKYIHFIDCSNIELKTKYFICRNNSNGSYLGDIKWNCGWRQYCFFPNLATVFAKSCLEDINNFIQQLTDERVNRGGHRRSKRAGLPPRRERNNYVV